MCKSKQHSPPGAKVTVHTWCEKSQKNAVNSALWMVRCTSSSASRTSQAVTQSPRHDPAATSSEPVTVSPGHSRGSRPSAVLSLSPYSNVVYPHSVRSEWCPWSRVAKSATHLLHLEGKPSQTVHRVVTREDHGPRQADRHPVSIWSVPFRVCTLRTCFVITCYHCGRGRE